jgi:hypothetical protein
MAAATTVSGHTVPNGTGTAARSRPRPPIEAAVLALACMFMGAIPWAASVVVPGLGTFTRLIGLLLMGMWVASVLIEDRIRQLSLFHRAAYLWVAWNGLALFWSPDPLGGFIRFTQYIQLFLFAVIIWNLRPRRQEINWLLQSYVFGCWIAFFLLLNNVVTGNVTRWQSRASLANTNENEIGMMLALGMSVAWYLAFGNGDPNSSTRRFRILNYLFLGAGFLGIMFTASRGSFLATGPVVLYVIYTATGVSAKRKLMVAVPVIALAVAAVLLVPDSAWDRIGTIPDQLQNRDLGSRFSIWSEGIPLLMANAASFLFGRGPVSFVALTGKAAHNIWLSVAVETGVVGLLLFATMAWKATTAPFRLASVDRALWLTLFATFWLASFALSLEYNKMTWALFAISVAWAASDRSTSS